MPPSRFATSSPTCWLDHRAAGILLHPTCFPGDFGIGALGAEARAFIDCLAECDMRYWQVCPLGPTAYGDSPYQCVSAFAGNPYLVDMLPLVEHGLLPPDSLGPLLFLPHDYVDYGSLYKLKWPLLRRAFDGFTSSRAKLPYSDFEIFKKEHAHWLDPFAWYHALKTGFGGKPWYEWPAELRSWPLFNQSREIDSPEFQDAAEAQRFYQYLFFEQWKELRRYANERNIEIIGDIPIFVSFDSSDVWSNPEIFQLDRSGLKPRALAGVPPDYFSADGQLWGNPLFDWETLRKSGYSWWMDRLRANFDLYDVIRIDHFRGFESYWSIPAGAKTAKEGCWIKGPGLDFFRKVHEVFPEARIIAEDLGILTPEVFELLEATGFPGMAVLQFAFGGAADNFYLPHNLNKNSVIYPGTHDNDTTLGWYRSLDRATRDHVRRYLGISGSEMPWDFIRAAYQSVCRLAIFPLQDLMSLDSEARFNTPGKPLGNWQWRYQREQLNHLRHKSGGYLRELATLYGRDPARLRDPSP